MKIPMQNRRPWKNKSAELRSWWVKSYGINEPWDEVEAYSAADAAEKFAEDAYSEGIREGYEDPRELNAIEVKKGENTKKIWVFNIRAHIEVEFEAVPLAAPSSWDSVIKRAP